MDKQVYNHGIDISDYCVKRIINKLKRLKSTIDIRDNGQYYNDPTYSQIFIKTTLTTEQLENWLYNIKMDIDYVGVYDIE